MWREKRNEVMITFNAECLVHVMVDRGACVLMQEV